jgi:hypothetical protein
MLHFLVLSLLVVANELSYTTFLPASIRMDMLVSVIGASPALKKDFHAPVMIVVVMLFAILSILCVASRSTPQVAKVMTSAVAIWFATWTFRSV